MPRLITPTDATKFIDERKRRGLLFRRPRKKFEYGWRLVSGNETLLANPPSFPAEVKTVLAPMDTSTIIPRDQWQDLVAKQEDNSSRPVDLMDYHKLPCLDQGGLNYCHATSLVGCMHYTRAKAGLSYEPLSWISVGGEATGWRNKGANPFYDDLPVLTKYGACPLSYQGHAGKYSLKTSSWLDGWEEERKKYRVTEFTDCMIPGLEFDAMATQILLGNVVAIGLRWWSHAIYVIAIKYEDGKWWGLIQNSWGDDWEDGGRAWFPEGKINSRTGAVSRGGCTPDISSIVCRSMVSV